MTSVLDSILLQNNFSTPAIRSIWSDDNKISKQLAVEAALAKIEGDLASFQNQQLIKLWKKPR